MFRHRLSTYKNHNELQPDELRRRRENTAELVQKRNREILTSTLRLQDKTYLKEIEKEENIAELPDLTKIICFGTFEDQFIATRTLRRFAYKEDGPIHEIIECGLLPLIVERLSSASYKIQYQAAWTLSNIAAEGSKQALDVIKSGAVPILIRLLQSPNNEVKEHVLWALGNVAGHSSSPDNRDFVISHGVFPPLLEIINNSKRNRNIIILSSAVRTLSYLCKGKNPPPDWSQISTALPALVSSLQVYDADVLENACWAFSYISGYGTEQAQAVIDSGACPGLIDALSHRRSDVVKPALQCIRHLTGFTSEQTQFVIDSGGLKELYRLLTHTSENVRYQACWTLANITTGSVIQIQDVIDEGIVPRLLQILEKDDKDVRKEACQVISNICSVGSSDQVKFAVKSGCIKPLCDIDQDDSETNIAVLFAFKNVLKIGELEKEVKNGVNEMANLIRVAGGLEKVYQLQLKDLENIRDLVIEVLSYY